MSDIEKIEIGGQQFDISDAQSKQHIQNNSVHLVSFKVNGTEYKNGDTISLNLEPSSENSKIDIITKNGEELPITDKTVNIEVPTKLSELETDENHSVISETERNKWNLASEKIIQKKDYSNITASGSNYQYGTIYLGKLITTNLPWSISIRIISDINNVLGSAQSIELCVGGYGNTICYCQNKNVISSEDNLSAYSIIFAMNKTNSSNLIGLNIQNSYNQNHNISFEIFQLLNCEILFLEGEKHNNIDNDYIIKQIGFRQSGIYGDGSGDSGPLTGILTIGPYQYNGSENITIPIYNGE